MYISMKYVILYVGAGAITGWLSRGNLTIGLIGVVFAALAGSSFGLPYAILGAIEFGVGLWLSSIFQKNEQREQEKLEKL